MKKTIVALMLASMALLGSAAQADEIASPVLAGVVEKQLGVKPQRMTMPSASSRSLPSL